MMDATEYLYDIRKELQETNGLLRNLIGVCTDIKFELVNARLERERSTQRAQNDKSSETFCPDCHNKVVGTPIDLGLGGVYRIKLRTAGGNLSPEEREEFERLSFEGMVEQYEKEMKQE